MERFPDGGKCAIRRRRLTAHGGDRAPVHLDEKLRGRGKLHQEMAGGVGDRTQFRRGVPIADADSWKPVRPDGHTLQWVIAHAGNTRRLIRRRRAIGFWFAGDHVAFNVGIGDTAYRAGVEIDEGGSPRLVITIGVNGVTFLVEYSSPVNRHADTRTRRKRRLIKKAQTKTVRCWPKHRRNCRTRKRGKDFGI